MYANMLVKLTPDAAERCDAANEYGTLSAHEITFPKNGRVLVHLDDPEDEGSYAAPAGLRSFEPAEIERITADF